MIRVHQAVALTAEMIRTSNETPDPSLPPESTPAGPPATAEPVGTALEPEWHWSPGP